MEKRHDMKNAMKAWMFALLLIAGILFPVAADVAGNSVIGAALYTATYNQYNATTTSYFSKIYRYSDLSAVDGQILLLTRAEKVESGAIGWINMTVSIQRANGTNDYIQNSAYWDFFAPDGLQTLFSLEKGDNALVTIFPTNATNNMTYIQVAEVSSAVELTVNQFPSIENVSAAFSQIAHFEKDVILDLYWPIRLTIYAVLVVGIPSMFILLILWSLRKIKKGAKDLME